MATKATNEKAEQAASPAVDPVLRVRVLDTGVKFGGLKFAKGAEAKLVKSAADALKEAGLVEIIGA